VSSPREARREAVDLTRAGWDNLGTVPMGAHIGTVGVNTIFSELWYELDEFTPCNTG